MYLAIDLKTKQLNEFEWTKSDKLVIDGKSVSEKDFEIIELNIGDKVFCNGIHDKITSFITAADVDNYAMGYVLVLEEHGTQAANSCYYFD